MSDPAYGPTFLNGLDEPERDEFGDPLECLDDPKHSNKGRCEGAVKNRPSLSGTGTPIPRCDRHWDIRQTDDEKHREIYPDSDMPPAWFDPANAGERWNEDD